MYHVFTVSSYKGIDKDIRSYDLTDEDIKEIINILKDKYVAS